MPALAATAFALLIVYGIYHGLTAKQIIGVASGTPGGGFHELGEKLLQGLNTDLDEQRLEAQSSSRKSSPAGLGNTCSILLIVRRSLVSPWKA